MTRVDKVVEYKKANVSAARVAIRNTDTAITKNATKHLKVVDSISVHKAHVIITECAFKLHRNRDISVDVRELDITDLDAKQVINYAMKLIFITIIVYLYYLLLHIYNVVYYTYYILCNMYQLLLLLKYPS